MGGYSSGRYRTKNRGATEHTLRLDMRYLRRAGFVRPGAMASGPLRWSRGGEETGSITLTVDLRDMADPFARLDFSVDGEARTQRIRVHGVSCRYGGQRFYFACPQTGRRCEVLCCVSGVFASRQAQRLAYASQSEDALGRLHRAKARIDERLQGEGRRPRPRGQNRQRLQQRWAALDWQLDELFSREAMRRFGWLF
jgi:hypothetical protein